MDAQSEENNPVLQDADQTLQPPPSGSSAGDWFALAIPFTLGVVTAVVPLVFFNFPLYILPLVFCLQLFLRAQRLHDQLKRTVGYILAAIMLLMGLGMFFFLFKPIG